MTEETLNRANKLTAKIKELTLEHERVCAALDSIDVAVDAVDPFHKSIDFSVTGVDPFHKSIEPVRILTVRGDYRVTVTRAEWEAMLTTAKDRLLSDIAKNKAELETL